MREIWIPELIGVFFLLLFIFRPLVKWLWPLEGLSWFPLLALLITLGLFPAYGFRPECLPLLLYCAVLTLLNSLHTDDFRDRRLVFIFPTALLLALASAVALFFAPLDSAKAAGSPRLVDIRDERQNRSYILSIFGPGEGAGAAKAGPGRPLLLLIPPEAGGLRAVDSLCAALEGRGFTVISYSRRGFDSPGPAKLLRMWQSFRTGTIAKKANDIGRALEKDRGEDLEFLLPYIRRNSAALAPGADPETLILAGCGAGGAALAYLAADPAFMAQNRQIRGIAAVESRFWSLYKPEERSALPVPASANWLKKAWIALRNRFAGLRPLGIAGLEPLPQPGVPALYLLSDRALDVRIRQKRYKAVFQLLWDSPAPGAFAALSGAGPLDYFDYPAEYPVYSALFPGLGKTPPGGSGYTEETAGIIANFAAALLTARLPENGLKTRSLGEGFHIETQSWNLPDLGYILGR